MKVSDLVFGLMASQHKSRYSFNDLRYLCAPFAVSEAVLRTNLARMVSAQAIQTKRIGRHAWYAFADKGKRIRTNVAHGFQALHWDTWDHTYWGVVFSVPEAHGEKRHAIRKKLSKYRFACMNPGLWIRPVHPEETIAEALQSMLDSDFCRLIRFFNHNEFTPDQVNQMWTLDAVNQELTDGISLLEHSTEKLANLSPAMAFVEKMIVGNAIVNTIFRDPMLPPQFLPNGWKGDEIRAAFRRFDHLATQCSKPYWEHIYMEEDVK